MITPISVAITAAFLIASASSQTISLNNNSSMNQNTEKYFMMYKILREKSSNPSLRIILNLKNFNDSAYWTSSGKQGLYLGVGYNSFDMKNADFTMCKFIFTGRASDSFTCTDGFLD